MSKSDSLEGLLAARRYFNDAEPRFWTWSDDAIAWPDGVTIVFYRELAELFRRLALDGLPRFSPLLLLLAACRENYRRERVEHELHQEQRLVRDAAPYDVRPPDESLGYFLPANELLAALDRVAQLPPELRSSIDAKAALIETVFAGQRFVPAEDALNVLELLRTVPPDELFETEMRFTPGRLGEIEARALRKLREAMQEGKLVRTRPHVSLALMSMRPGLNRIDADALRLRLRTGLDQLIKPAEIEPPADESVRALIARLRDDPELAGLGRLAHDLLAAVQVPRAISDPEELQLGGVSDITNRGPLDRLLTSELAHDDLALAVRVASGEALYLRREAPPRTPVRARCVLVDCGIRLWGVPRVFAAAVGLALAAAADRRATTAAWRATADGIEPVDLRSRAGLIALLAQLEAAPQPAGALGRFFEEVDRAGVSADAIVITHEDVLADGDFRRALDGLTNRRFYVATVDREGRFCLRVRSGRGTKLIREARFDLDRLLSPPRRPARALLQHDTGSDLPAILSVKPFPLLLPHQVRFDRFSFHAKYGAVTLTHDGRLMHWAKQACAAAELTAAVPRGTFRHLSIDGEGIVRVVVGGTSPLPLRFVRANLTSGEVRMHNVDVAPDWPHSIVHDQRVFYLIGRRSIRAVTDDGEVSAEIECSFRHAGGRFFGRGVWYALSFDGQSPQLTRVPIHNSIALGSIAAMFDIQGREGPWVVTDFGQVRSTVDGSLLMVPRMPTGTASVVAISDDGHVVLLEDSQRALSLHRLHLSPDVQPTSEIHGLYAAKWKIMYPEATQFVSSQSMSWRYFSISAEHEGRLALTSRRGSIWCFGLKPPQSHLMTLGSATPLPRLTQPFQPTAGPPNTRFRLRIARWADGSRAWLDSRGLLHLKSSDRTLPELTIVLAPDAEVSAWASDGRVWGLRFYTGRSPEETRPGEELWAEIEAFVGRLK